MIAYQHLKPGTQIFGNLISEFDSFTLIWQIKNKIRPIYPFKKNKTMGNKIFFVWCLSDHQICFSYLYICNNSRTCIMLILSGLWVRTWLWYQPCMPYKYAPGYYTDPVDSLAYEYAPGYDTNPVCPISTYLAIIPTLSTVCPISTHLAMIPTLYAL